MAKFVNYKKRGFTLPAGCKDLIDLLVPSKRLAANTASTVEPPQITKEHFRTHGLSQIDRYVKMLLASSAELFALMITLRDDRFPLTLYRSRNENHVGLVMLAEKIDREQAIRAFFDEQGVQTLQTHDLPHAFRGLNYILPVDASRISGIVTDLLRGVYDMSDVAGLDFRYYEVQTTA